MESKVNFVFKIFLALVYGVVFLYFSLSGKALEYVHPKIVPIMIACGIIFICSFFVLLRNKHEENAEKVNFSIIIFILPIILALIFPTQTLNKEFTDMSKQTSEDNKGNVNKEDLNSEDVNNDISVNEKLSSSLIKIDTGDFINILNELYEKIDDYVGKEVEIEGFVYKEDRFGDKFIISRSLMVCCAADTQVVGLMCDYNDSKSLKQNSWFKVVGTIEKYTFEDKIVPLIKISSLSPIEELKNSYVYPY